MSIGVRELKAGLSEFIRRAAAGEDVVITDHGRPVARIVPYVGVSDVERGIEQGWIEAPRRTQLSPVTRVASRRSVMDVLDEDRG